MTHAHAVLLDRRHAHADPHPSAARRRRRTEPADLADQGGARAPDAVLPSRDAVDGIAITRIPFRGSHRYPLAPGFLPHLAGADLVHVRAIDFFFDALALTRPLHGTPLVATTHGGFFHTPAFFRPKDLWFGGASGPVPVRRIVTLGRFSENERLDRLIDTMGELQRREPGWHLDVIGVESDWSVERLCGRIGAAGRSDAIEGRVGLDDRAIARVMRAASFFVSASAYEGFGLALIEALSAGSVPLVQPNAAFAAVAADHPEVGLVDFADARAAAVRDAFASLCGAPAGARSGPDLSRYAWPGVAARSLDVDAACCPAFSPDRLAPLR